MFFVVICIFKLSVLGGVHKVYRLFGMIYERSLTHCQIWTVILENVFLLSYKFFKIIFLNILLMNFHIPCIVWLRKYVIFFLFGAYFFFYELLFVSYVWLHEFKIVRSVFVLICYIIKLNSCYGVIQTL